MRGIILLSLLSLLMMTTNLYDVVVTPTINFFVTGYYEIKYEVDQLSWKFKELEEILIK